MAAPISAQNRSPSLSSVQRWSLFLFVRMQNAIGPLGVSMMPASVRDEFTEPVLWATLVPFGNNRGTLILSSQANMCSSICFD